MNKQDIANAIFEKVKNEFYDCGDAGLIGVICDTIYYSIIESGDPLDYLDEYLIYEADKWEMLLHYCRPEDVDYYEAYDVLLNDIEKIYIEFVNQYEAE